MKSQRVLKQKSICKVMEQMVEIPELCLLSGDIGNRMFDKLRKLLLTDLSTVELLKPNDEHGFWMAPSGLRPVVILLHHF